MKTLEKYTLLALLLTLQLSSMAQPTVDVCLNKTATELEIKIRPATSFVGVVSNIQLAIKCSDPTVTYSAAGNTLSYCTMAKAGDVVSSGGSGYQKFAGFGFFNMSILGSSWTANTEYTLFTVVPSSLNPSFEIAVDAWASTNNGVYYAELNGLDQTGSTFVCGAGVLAASDLSLQAKPLDDRQVQLQWKSHSGTPISHFILEKRLGETEFVSIAQLSGEENTSTYDYIDLSLMAEVNHYRIKQISLDGNFVYSNVESVRMPQVEGVIAYPIPAEQEVNIGFRHAQTKAWHLSLLNSQGQILLHRDFPSQATSAQLNLQGLAAGMYFYRIQQGGKVWEGKLLKASRE
jgi:hypothetical protein